VMTDEIRSHSVVDIAVMERCLLCTATFTFIEASDLATPIPTEDGFS
jgi:hypothetical protein